MIAINRMKKILRNIIIIGILIFIFLKSRGLYLNPISAYRNTERISHYGPSDIIHIEDSGKSIHILGKYDKWVSYTEVYRKLGFFWYSFGSSVTNEINLDEGITYTWTAYNGDFMIFGTINDKDIVKVELVFENGETHSQSDFYDEDIFSLKTKTYEETIGIRGYDKDNNLIFEQAL